MTGPWEVRNLRRAGPVHSDMTVKSINAKWLELKVNATNNIQPPGLEVDLPHKMENV